MKQLLHTRHFKEQGASENSNNGHSRKPAETQPPPKSRTNESRHQLLLLAALIVLAGLVGVLVWDFALQNENIAGTEHNAVLGFTIFIQAMITFFGILNLEEQHSNKISPLTKGGMRCAIAGALVVTYIFLVIFHTTVDFVAGQTLPPQTSPLKDQFVNSFTGIVNSTIIFYFASEAALHWINTSKRKEPEA